MNDPEGEFASDGISQYVKIMPLGGINFTVIIVFVAVMIVIMVIMGICFFLCPDKMINDMDAEIEAYEKKY